MRKSNTEHLQHANSTIINGPIVSDKLSDSPTNNKNGSPIVSEELSDLSITNGNGRLCSVEEEFTLADKDHETIILY